MNKHKFNLYSLIFQKHVKINANLWNVKNLRLYDYKNAKITDHNPHLLCE